MIILCIAGRAGSGKDTVAKILDEILTEQYHKRVLVAHYADLVKYVAKTFFYWDGIKDEEGRTLLQYIGTDVVRKADENYWVRFIANMLKFFPNQWDFVLLPDFRFPNECSLLKRYLYPESEVFSVKVDRNFPSTLTPEQQAHASETALNGFNFDYYIDNNGTYEDLYKQMSNTFAPMLIERLKNDFIHLAF